MSANGVNGSSTDHSPESGSIRSEAKEELIRGLEGSTAKLLFPDSDGYDAHIKRWSDTCEKRAAAIVLPQNTREVSLAIRLARDHHIPFVVAGGRHSTSGSSSILDGIVIDLRAMRKVEIDQGKKIITAQGGTTWADIDKEAGKYSLAIPGGTVSHTGVGGLTLGGGYGWLSGRHGLVIDCLLSVEMVLADGSIVSVSKESDPDLFWAVRGAGQCFGVATEFRFRAFEQGFVFGGMVAFTPDKIDKVVNFANRFHEVNDGDQGMTFGFATAPGTTMFVVLAAIFYNGQEDQAREFFKPLLIDAGPILNQTAMMPYEKVNALSDDLAGPGGRKLFGGSNVVLPLSSDFVQSVFDEFTGFISSHEGTAESMILFEILPYRKINELPLEATACANRGEYYNVGSLFAWKDPSMDQEVRTFNRQLNGRIRAEGGSKRSKAVGVYSNYLQTSRTPEEVFGVNTARLRELKQKYDPANVFNSWHDLMA